MGIPAGHSHKETTAPVMDAVPYMWRWAEWRKNGCHGRAWPTMSMTGKIMQGMRSTVCPSCRGEGRMPGWRIDSDLAWIDPCPQCHGWGKVSGDLEAETRTSTIPCFDCGGTYRHRRMVPGKGDLNGMTCIKCRGSGVRLKEFERINPASIRATRFVGANEDDDPPSMMIDRTVAGWSAYDGTWWFHKIAVVEYAVGGTQEMKGSRLGCSQAFYARTLRLVHAAIEERLLAMFE